MKKEKEGIIGIFQYLDDVCETAEKIKSREDFKDHVVYSHTSYHDLMDIAEERYGDSPVKWFTCAGALTGVTCGFAMPLLMDYDWPLVVGGKTAGIYSLPAYVIFGFELMILLGAIATILGMLVMGRLPNPKVRIYDERLTDDRFAIVVPGASLDGSAAEFLRECGAEEVRNTKDR